MCVSQVLYDDIKEDIKHCKVKIHIWHWWTEMWGRDRHHSMPVHDTYCLGGKKTACFSSLRHLCSVSCSLKVEDIQVSRLGCEEVAAPGRTGVRCMIFSHLNNSASLSQRVGTDSFLQPPHQTDCSLSCCVTDLHALLELRDTLLAFTGLRRWLTLC